MNHENKKRKTHAFILINILFRPEILRLKCSGRFGFNFTVFVVRQK